MSVFPWSSRKCASGMQWTRRARAPRCEPLPTPSFVGVAAVAALGLVTTPTGFVAFFRLIAIAGPDRAALITYVAPVVAVTTGALVLSEPVGTRTLAGTALIIIGAWLATRVPRSGPAEHDAARRSRT